MLALSSSVDARTVPDIYISVGSNIEPDSNVRAALQALKQEFTSVTVSPVYRSAAVGFVGEDFLNLVVAAETRLSPSEVAARLQGIENRFGRDRSLPKFSARTLDLDLLLYDDVVLDSGGLHLPRAEIAKYGFVLAPLADIAGKRCHPSTGETFESMWRKFDASAEKLEKIPFDWG